MLPELDGLQPAGALSVSRRAVPHKARARQQPGFVEHHLPQLYIDLQGRAPSLHVHRAHDSGPIERRSRTHPEAARRGVANPNQLKCRALFVPRFPVTHNASQRGGKQCWSSSLAHIHSVIAGETTGGASTADCWHATSGRRTISGTTKSSSKPDDYERFIVRRERVT